MKFGNAELLVLFQFYQQPREKIENRVKIEIGGLETTIYNLLIDLGGWITDMCIFSTSRSSNLLLCMSNREFHW